jgi:hypothetical protein
MLGKEIGSQMKLRAHFDEAGELELTAATYSTAEFDALQDVLGRLGIIRIRNPARRDRTGRQVREYHVPRRSVRRLEAVLGGHFEDDGTFVSRATRKGKRYACREVATSGRSRGCEEIIATDDSTAVVKCALIASRNEWFGSEAKAGACSDRP